MSDTKENTSENPSDTTINQQQDATMREEILEDLTSARKSPIDGN